MKKKKNFVGKKLLQIVPSYFFNHYEAEVFEMSEKLDQPMFVYKSSWV